MTLRRGWHSTPEGFPQESSRGCGKTSLGHPSADELLARRVVLERAYPIAKQLAEVLELEDAELADVAKGIRKRIGVALIGLGHDR